MTVSTGVGDGQYFVYARMGKIKGVPEGFRNLAKLERLAGVKVEFTPWRPNKEPPPRRKEERTKEGLNDLLARRHFVNDTNTDTKHEQPTRRAGFLS